MTAKSKSEANKKAIGIRLDKEVLDLLAEASTTAGVSRTEIIEECVRAQDNLDFSEEELNKIDEIVG